MPRGVFYDARSALVTAAARRLAHTVEVRPWHPQAPLPEERAVLLVDGGADVNVARDVQVIGIVDPAAPGPWPDWWHAVVPAGAGAAVLARAVEGAFADAERAAERARLERALSDLNAIGILLSSERDPAVLLETILSKAREITESDAGSLYLVEDGPDGRRLRFALAQNDSVEISFRAVTLPLDHGSVAGHVALTGAVVNLADAYASPPDAGFSIDRRFDAHAGYRTRSMLVVPMRTPQGETLGVLQLINCKPDVRGPLAGADAVARHVRPFGTRHETLAGSLASQAAVALHNGRLYASIQQLFDGFVQAAVTAIEARDPTTSGHSFRVADLTVALAMVVDRADGGPHGATRVSPEELRELRYAALLHDFGKVGVREHVLVKARKLYPVDLERIRHRVELLARDVEVRTAREKLEHVLRHGAEGFAALAGRLDAELAQTIRDLFRQLDLVTLANEPSVLPRDFAADLLRLTARAWLDADGEPRAIVTPEEARVLAIPRGSLTADERREIEAHVVHTFDFLQRIPWTRELRRVPELARSHHEKLDGSGYPHGLRADQIPLGSRMMAIADVYDALTATDRPYKKAVRVEEALSVLEHEREAGAIDGALLDLFVGARVWERVPGPG
jgi:HD-GYP domain-containing protein (c-di-GMP phosphodiesterase class II)